MEGDAFGFVCLSVTRNSKTIARINQICLRKKDNNSRGSVLVTESLLLIIAVALS